MNRHSIVAGSSPDQADHAPAADRRNAAQVAGATGTATDAAAGWSYRSHAVLTPFPRTSWGHRGYDEAGVDAYVAQVDGDRAAAVAEIADLRSEVDRLHRYIRRQWAAVAAAEAAGGRSAGRSATTAELVSPAAQARAVLTAAQEIAERRLAQADRRLAEADRLAGERLAAADRSARAALDDADDAVTRTLAEGDRVAAQRLSRVDAIVEQVLGEARQDAEARRAKARSDSHRLLMVARARYENIVVRAHQRADAAAGAALDEFCGDSSYPSSTEPDDGRDRGELELKAAYLRTFAKVSRVALDAALDVTAQEFDRLLGATVRGELARDGAFSTTGDIPRLISSTG